MIKKIVTPKGEHLSKIKTRQIKSRFIFKPTKKVEKNRLFICRIQVYHCNFKMYVFGYFGRKSIESTHWKCEILAIFEENP